MASRAPLCPAKAAHAFHLISYLEETLLKPPGGERAVLSLLHLLSWVAFPYLHCFQNPFGTRVQCHRDPVSVEVAESASQSAWVTPEHGLWPEQAQAWRPGDVVLWVHRLAGPDFFLVLADLTASSSPGLREFLPANLEVVLHLARVKCAPQWLRKPAAFAGVAGDGGRGGRPAFLFP